MTDAPASRVRPARRSPSDLSFTFEDRHVEHLTAGEPAWLSADRRAALARFAALPIESNMLYTTYVDLRTAVLDDVEPYDRSTGDDLLPRGAAAPEAGTAGLASFREDRVETLALDDAASRAGVTLETLGAFIADGAAEALVARADFLPEDDRIR